MKKLFVTFGVLVLALGLMACGKKKTEEVAQTPAPVTEAPTATPEVETQVVEEIPEGMVKSKLTGEWITEKVAEERPMAMMINNIAYANAHQRGTSKFDILYEAVTEGGITRMMGVFQGKNKIKKTGSVRSARHYYVSFASEWDAIFCHFGQTKYAVAKIKKLKMDTLSGLSAIGPVVYWRDSKLVPPHNVFTDGKHLKKGMKRLKLRGKVKEEKMAQHFDFYDEDEETDLSEGKSAKSVLLPFSEYSVCTMKYKNGEYKKFEYGKKHKDHANNKQLSFKNVIIQIIKEGNIDHNGYQQLYIQKNQGKGYYLTNGKRIPITWKKNEKKRTMAYYDENGQLLTINPGKTYIAMFPKNRKGRIKFK